MGANSLKQIKRVIKTRLFLSNPKSSTQLNLFLFIVLHSQAASQRPLQQDSQMRMWEVSLCDIPLRASLHTLSVFVVYTVIACLALLAGKTVKEGRGNLS